MSVARLSYPQWKAPREDGQMLIWPEPAQLLAQTRENHRRLVGAERVIIQGIPLAELRRHQRQWIGHEGDQLLLATGHQTELHHPGVWVKNALINAAASALDGAAYHFAVDTDEPKHLTVRYPGGSDPITDDPNLNQAEWSGLLNTPTPAHLREIETHLASAAAGWGFEPMAPGFLQAMRRLGLESDNLSAVQTNALHELDWQLGLRHHALVTSPLWQSEPYGVFLHHLLARAGEFAAQYNAALADYRQAHGLQTATRPMPDLRLSDGRCETPFWLDDLATGQRQRAQVTRRDGGPWRVTAGNGEAFELDPQAEGWSAGQKLIEWLRCQQLRLSPRALTLTMFLRLLLVDQFVHGIGGGRYDQVLDRLIASHFGLEPPHFSVTTATLYFPLAIGRTRACLPCVIHQGHQLRHRLLGEEKQEYLAEIASLPRRSLARSGAFHHMHHRLDEVAVGHPALAQWESTLQETAEQAREDELLFNRELFYALQPEDRLAAMIQRYRSAMD